MKKNIINKDYASQVLKENYADYLRYGDLGDPTTLREYVEAQGDTDPRFFGWLFNNGDIENFADLTDDQKEEYQNFLDEL